MLALFLVCLLHILNAYDDKYGISPTNKLFDFKYNNIYGSFVR